MPFQHGSFSVGLFTKGLSVATLS